jgi:gp178
MSFLDVTKILKDKGYNGVSDNDVVTSLKEVEYIPPNTPEVPPSVKDWIRLCKSLTAFRVSLSYALNPYVWEINHLSQECQEWLYDADNQETFALLWIGRDWKEK